ncbi:CHAT domain-containing protein [Streptomyces sp. NRRL S-31]|uniref:CHAT domain-containing protein n=1 Tax=Streptomyces sp. NRRL S-31 TaxID=1463898 RepID=UPI00069CAF66|nr:CHAT domain-containing protein [Streptomyces sp. NRRL S-31]
MGDGASAGKRADGDLGGVSDEELREWIARTRAEPAGQPPDGGPAAAADRVAMGLWLAELAERQGDPRDLDAAIAAVARALDDDPGHPEAPLWHGLLGQLHWFRYEKVCEPGVPPERQAALLVEATRHLEAAAAVLPPGEETTRQVRGRLGIAYGTRFCHTNDPADLEAAIAQLGGALDGVPEPMGQSAFFRFHYGQQFTRRFDATGAETDLDRGLAEIRRAVEEGEKSTECEDGWFPIARAQLARILLIRLPAAREHRDPRDADLALAQLEGLPLDSPLMAELPPPVLRNYGRLLCERAGEQLRPADATRSLAVLRQVAEQYPADAPDRWVGLMDVAAAWQLVALGTLDAEALRDAEDAYTEALSEPGCPPGVRTFMEATRGYLRGVRVRAGHLPDLPDDPVVRAGLAAAAALRQATAVPGAAGERADEDGAGDFQRLGLASLGPGGEDLQRVTERCQRADASPALRRLPLMLMTFFAPFLAGLGIRPTAEEVLERVRAALTVLPQDDPVRTSLHMVAGQVALTASSESYDPEQAQVALDHFDTALAGAGAAAESDALRSGREVWRIAALAFRGLVRGTRDALAQAAAELTVLRDDPSVSAYTRVYAAVQHALIKARQAFATNDAAGLAAAAADLRDARDRLPADDAMRPRVVVMLDALASARLFLTPDAGPRYEDVDPDRIRREAAPMPPPDRAEALGMAGLAIGLRVLRHPDPGRLDAGIALLQEALALDPADGGGKRLRFAHTLAMLRLHRYDSGHDGTDLDEAVRWNEEAVRLAAHPGHFGWAPAAMQLAEVYRRVAESGRGDRAEHLARGRETGLRALRGHAWQVLLQSQAQYTAETLAVSASHALTVARWCIADGCPAEAVQALDAGRGLVLHAASAAGTVPERLAAAGRPDLAAEWRTAAAGDGPGAADGIPGDLRYRVLRVLAGTDDLLADGLLANDLLTDDSPAGGPADGPADERTGGPVDELTGGPADGPADERTGGPVGGRSDGPADDAGTAGPRSRLGHLLVPPSLHDIATALRRAGADAMVYLVPGEGAGSGRGGCAVAVHPDGRTSLVRLPELTVDAPALVAHLGSGADSGSRDMGPADGAPPPSADARAAGHRTLEALCDWASEAVTEPLLTHLRAWGATRPPKVVLVPMGQLAAVPWHAARRSAPGGRYRYALQDAVFSYAASARLFCDVVAGEPVPYDAPALVVGNPTGDLPHAGREAAALHAAFYRTAPYLGRHATGTPAGAGTPAEVLGWLRLRGLSPGGVLHLACHAEVDRNTTVRTAHLHLAGGTLAAEQLTEQAQRHGRTGRLGLVSLAACTTHVSGRGYDEAFTLSTAFLVEGAGSVLGSLWPVPDEATSYLMFMVHHYLHAEGARPAAALRLAQLWMLDPDRRPPSTMPPELARRVRSLNADDLRGWAGFTHLGQ